MPPPNLSNDTIDDIIYCARANETEELFSTLSSTAQSTGANPQDVLASAVEEHSGSTALHMAAANGHLDILERILDYFSNPSSGRASSGAEQGNGEALVPAPVTAFVNIQNASGNTALHWAALNGHLDAVKALVAVGADLEVRNKAGRDVVFEAEGAGKEEVVSWLLGVGAEKEVEQSKGEEGAEEKIGEGGGEGSSKSVEEGVEEMELGEK